MKLIRCTRKLLKELGIGKADPVSEVAADPCLGEWYANLLRIDRRKCVLFTDAETLFSFLVPGVRKPDLDTLNSLFTDHLTKHLAAEGFLDDVIDELAGDGQVQIGATKDRSVLGSMNDLAYLYQVHIEEGGGLARYDSREVTRKINRTPMSANRYQYAVEVLKDRVRSVAM